MTKANFYVDISVLQTVPSSNINRDDTGSPKTAWYGGAMRSRVSSQSWKHAMRKAFEKKDGLEIGVRTKKSSSLLLDAIQEIDATLDPAKVQPVVAKALELVGSKADEKKSALIFISHGQIAQLAQYIVDNVEKMAKELEKKSGFTAPTKKGIKKSLENNNALDLALFGRMFASASDLNIEAAAQVAHAISTHEVTPEFDYFTAVDDLQKDNESGAAMIASNDFNSATLFRYANLNMNELIANLNKEDALQAAAVFIKEFALSMPTGKQNSYANKTVPSYVMVTLRDDIPVNLVSAFEEPVRSESGYMHKSILRLEAEYTNTACFVDQPIANFILDRDSETQRDDEIGNKMATMPELLDTFIQKASEVVDDENTDD